MVGHSNRQSGQVIDLIPVRDSEKPFFRVGFTRLSHYIYLLPHILHNYTRIRKTQFFPGSFTLTLAENGNSQYKFYFSNFLAIQKSQ